jgi:hypothetical protein
MRRAALASILVLPLAASFAAADSVPASAVVSADPDQDSLALLRAIRAESTDGDADTASLRDWLAGLKDSASDDVARERLQRAAGYIDRLDSGQPLPPPAPDEISSADDQSGAERETPSRRAQEIADARQVEAKTSTLLDQVAAVDPAAGPATGAFDGGKPRRKLVVDEPEPGPGYHTANIDAWLSQTDDDGRAAVLSGAISDLLAKLGEKDKDGKRAKDLAARIGALIAANPFTGRMEALRVRVRPDGGLVLIYRVRGGGVVEEDLGMSLEPVSNPKSAHFRARRKKKRKAAGGGGGDDGGGKAKGKGKGKGKGDDGGGGGGGGGGDGGGGGRRGEGGDEGAGDGGDAALADGGDAQDSGVVNPDGGSGGRHGRGRTASGSGPVNEQSAPGVSVPGGFTTAGAPDGDAAPAAERGLPPAARAAGSRGGAELELGALPHLRGDLPGGRPGAAVAAAAAIPAPRAAARGAVAYAPAPPSAPPAAAAVAAAAAPPAYSAAEDGPLRDAVAGDAVPTAQPAPAAPARPEQAPSRGAAVPALFVASAALGALGFFLRKPGA